jgi:hypothetical protein
VVDTGRPQAIEEAKHQIGAGAISEMNGLRRHVRIIAQIEVERLSKWLGAARSACRSSGRQPSASAAIQPRAWRLEPGTQKRQSADRLGNQIQAAEHTL